MQNTEPFRVWRFSQITAIVDLCPGARLTMALRAAINNAAVQRVPGVRRVDIRRLRSGRWRVVSSYEVKR